MFRGSTGMTPSHDHNYLVGLLRELCKLPRETEWLEFKENDADPHDIGEYTRVGWYCLMVV